MVGFEGARGSNSKSESGTKKGAQRAADESRACLRGNGKVIVVVCRVCRGQLQIAHSVRSMAGLTAPYTILHQKSLHVSWDSVLIPVQHDHWAHQMSQREANGKCVRCCYGRAWVGWLAIKKSWKGCENWEEGSFCCL
jgi:hypothetical protein